MEEAWDDIDRVFMGHEIGPMHFDRHGEPISMRTWVRLFGLAMEYRQIALTDVGPYHVSTVWTGLDHGFNDRSDPDYRPWIFETMVFANAVSHYPEEVVELYGKSFTLGGFDYHEDFEQRRYQTEQEALDDHERIVAEIELLVAVNPEWQPEGEGYPPRD